MNRYLAECIGTFCLVFAGCGAIVVNSLTGGAMIGHLGVAITFGLIVTAMIYSVGNVSGAHINPAVTVGFCLARRLPLRDGAAYVVAQLAGGCLAAGALRMIFPTADTLGATFPADWASPLQAAVMEGVLTFILMFVILNVSTGHMEKGIMAGVAVGGVVALEAIFGGPVSGASMNPARSLGPALVGGTLVDQWVYLAGPLVGAAAAVPLCPILQGPQCCDLRTAPTKGTPMPDDNRLGVLFLCTGNSCRSQMAEGWTRHLKSDVIDACSAGIETHGLNPHAVTVMAEAGVDISRQKSQHIDEFADVPLDYVVTVCSHAHETCPMFPGEAKVVHVGFDDPPRLAADAKTPEEQLDAYRRVRDEIRAFVETLPEGLTDNT
jgi:aquaporin Z